MKYISSNFVSGWVFNKFKTYFLKNNIICHKYNYLQIIFIEGFFRSYFDGHESKKEKETDFEEGKALEK